MLISLRKVSVSMCEDLQLRVRLPRRSERVKGLLLRCGLPRSIDDVIERMSQPVKYLWVSELNWAL